MSDEALPPLIDVRNLVKSYGEKTVIDGFDLTVERGETCVIIGGSGSGKTTLARLLIGLERADSGEIFIDGENLVGMGDRDLDRVRRKFAFVFQKYALLDSMSVFDNVAFPLRETSDLSESEIRTRVHHALDELGVDEASKQLPAELSGGMAKRVGIARAIVTDPEILIYDEPTTGLDPATSRVVDGLIERMRSLHGVTSIVITHDMVTAYEVSDRVVLLAGGKSLAQGPPEDLFTAHGKELEAFALSSAIDLAKLAPRTGRTTPAAIRAAWAARRVLPS